MLEMIVFTASVKSETPKEPLYALHSLPLWDQGRLNPADGDCSEDPVTQC